MLRNVWNATQFMETPRSAALQKQMQWKAKNLNNVWNATENNNIPRDALMLLSNWTSSKRIEMQQNATKLNHARKKTWPESMLRNAVRCNTINGNAMGCNNAQAIAMKRSDFVNKWIATKNVDVNRNSWNSTKSNSMRRNPTTNKTNATALPNTRKCNTIRSESQETQFYKWLRMFKRP